MQKHELLKALEGLADETDVHVHIRGEGRRDIVRAVYRPSNGDDPAYVDIIIDPFVERDHDYKSPRCWCGEANHRASTPSGEVNG